MSARTTVFAALAFFLAVVGYFAGAIVIALYAGIWLRGDKMAFETALAPHLFGAAGALAGVALAWGVVTLAFALLRARPRASVSRS